MSYGIMRCEKRKMQAAGGIHAENNRTADKHQEFKASDIDWNKTDENIFLVESKCLKADIEREIHRCGIDTWRKDAVTFIDTLYTASPEFFETRSKEEIKQYFEDCLNFHKQEFGNHVVNAVIHLDEATPHMHVQSVPLVEKPAEIGELGVPKPTEYKLSAKELMGNIKEYKQRQDRFFEAVSKGYGLDRGETKDAEHQREHLSSLQYKQQQTEKEIEARKSDLKAIEGKIRKADEFIQPKIKKSITGQKYARMEVDEAMDLYKTATKVEDVEKEKLLVQSIAIDNAKKKADLETREFNLGFREQQAEQNLADAQYWQEHLNELADKRKDGYTQRLEDWCDSIQLQNGKTALEEFQEMEAELSINISRGVSR